MFGQDFRAGRWSDLRPLERAALHGLITGDGRRGQIVVLLFSSAPPEAYQALLGPSRTERVIGRVADVAAIAILLLALGAVGWVGFNPIWSRPAPMMASKSTLRAGPLGLRAAAAEAKR